MEQSDRKPIGVSSRVLRELRDACEKKAGSVDPKFTTTDACNQVVKPLTVDGQRAYIDLFAARPIDDSGEEKWVGPATVFVSHAWRYSIFEVLDVLLQYAEENPDTFFWFDLAINNQHKATDLPQEWWKTTFQKSIADIGRTLVVLLPWDNPVPLTRAWCLWELFCSIETKEVDLKFLLPKSQEDAFRQALVDNPDAVFDALGNIQAEKSEAFLPADKEMIHNTIRETVSFLHLNSVVKNALREWLAAICETVTDSEISDELKMAKLKYAVANTWRELGMSAKSKHYFTSAYEAFKRIYGEEKHADLAGAINGLGMVAMQEGDIDGSITHFKNAIEGYEGLPDNAEGVSMAYNNLGLMLYRKERFEEALRALNQSLDLKKSLESTKGPNSDIGITLANIGNVYLTTKNYEKAKELYDAARDSISKALGDRHPVMATVLQSLADLSRSQDDFNSAIEFYKQAYAIQVEVLGDQHPNTIATCREIGDLYSANDLSDQAFEYYEQVMKHELNQCTRQDVHFVKGSLNLANAYMDIGRISDAIVWFRNALNVVEPKGGEAASNQVAGIYVTLGSAYLAQGDHEQAIQLYAKAQKALEHLYGSNHFTLAEIHLCLVDGYTFAGNFEKAVEHANINYQLCEANHGRLHPSTSQALETLGDVYSRKEDFDKAIECYLEQLGIISHAVGEDHSAVAVVCFNLGTTIVSRLRLPELKSTAPHGVGEAIIYLERSLKIRRGNFGNKSMAVATTLFGLSDAQIFALDSKGALESLTEAYALYSELLGPDHADSLLVEKTLQDVRATEEVAATADKKDLIERQKTLRAKKSKKFTRERANTQKCHEGFMVKEPEWLGGAKRRWFYLKGSILSYYTDQSKVFKKGEIQLGPSTELEQTSATRFTLSVPNRVYKLRCTDVMNTNMWVSAIQGVLNR